VLAPWATLMRCAQRSYKALSRYTDSANLEKLARVRKTSLLKWLLNVAELAKPSRVFVVTGSREDVEYIKRKAVENREEIPTRHGPLHTVHFDGPNDPARDRGNTKILISSGNSVAMVNTGDREACLREVLELFSGIMRGREIYVGFYCFGPRSSPYALYGVQVTDSAYVVHASNILYRICYDVFTERSDLPCMRFLHSAGERDENGWSRYVDKRRIYIDVEDQATYSVNTQYAGNTVGLKKLSLRLCIYRGCREGWLCEHMFIVGVKGPGDRLTYFTGAFPAGCGKTSTALIADTIVGDDLAIIRKFGWGGEGYKP